MSILSHRYEVLRRTERNGERTEGAGLLYQLAEVSGIKRLYAANIMDSVVECKYM
jgi:hypothetical protein